jgi:copper chaperone CopZ
MRARLMLALLLPFIGSCLFCVIPIPGPRGPSSSVPAALPDATAVLAVTPVDCAGCIDELRAALGALEGVRDTDVDPDTGTVLVRFSPELLTPDEIVDHVRHAGFSATLAPSAEAPVTSF